MARVGLDLDGVTYNFSDGLRRYLEDSGHFADKITNFDDPQAWEFYKVWGLTTPEFLEACHAGVDAGVIFATGEPYPGTEVIGELLDEGHEIHVLTDRSFGAEGASETATRSWLSYAKIPFSTITFTADKTCVETDLMIDDKVENYIELDAAGCEVYLMDRPWNQHLEGARRVYSLAEFADIVRAWEARNAELDKAEYKVVAVRPATPEEAATGVVQPRHRTPERV